MASKNGMREQLLGYKDCPGCKVAQLRQQGAAPPIKQLFLMAFIVIANGLPTSVLYPFLYFMVRDFHIAKKEEDIGYYAGWIGSSFMVGRIFTGVLWGIIADRYGRKVVFYSGIFSVLVFNTLFGIVPNYWLALLCRFLLGSFNGMLGTVLAYASDICSEEHQAFGVSVIATAWGVALILGPALGGYLARPAVSYPNIFKSDSLFGRYPYLLQAVCVSAFAVVAFFMCLMLPETVHKNHGHEGNIPDEEAIPDERAKTTKTKSDSLYKNQAFLASAMVYCLWALHDTAYLEILSLWAVSPRKTGGLSFSTADVGAILVVSSFVMLLSQITIFPMITRAYGPIRTIRFTALLAVPLLTAYPFVPHMTKTWISTATFTLTTLKSVFGLAVYAGSTVLINNSVKQEQRGAANGIALSIQSVFNAIGPASAGILFAWCQTRQHASFLPGNHLVFFALNGVAIITVFMTFEPIMPKFANKTLEEETVY